MSVEIKKRIITSIFLISLLILMYIYPFIMIISLIIISVILWIEFCALISKIIIKNSIKKRLYKFLYKLVFFFYLLFLISLIIYIDTYNLNLKIYLLYSIFVTILSDIGGLTFGKIFKGKKLSKISPNKTLSGSIGSFIFSLSLVPIFSSELIDFNFISLILVTLAISFISQLGDLFISYLKRKARVKDTSNILPGHGGFLDRVDGLIFAIPIGVLLFNFI